MNKVRGLISNLLLVVVLVGQIFGASNMMTVHASTGMTKLENVIVSGGYFDTGLMIDRTYSIEMTFSFSTLTQYKNIYSSNVYSLRNESTKGLFYRHGWYNERVYLPALNEEITVLNKKNALYVNGTLVKTATAQNITSTNTLKFGDMYGNIKSFKIWNGSNELVAEYIPVLDNSNKACMYNKVNGQYCYYSGNCKEGKKIETNETPEISESVENNGAIEIDKTESETESEVETQTPELSDNNNLTGSVNFVDGLMINGGTFDSGKMINQNNSIEMTFSLSSLGQYKNLYDALSSKGAVYRLRLEAKSGLFVRHGWYNEKIYSPQVDEEITVLQKKNVVYVNGEKARAATYQSLTAANTLKFGDFKGTIKSFKLWDGNGELIAEYIPALDVNNKACMYDNVSKDYVYYSGTCEAIVKETEEEETIESTTEEPEQTEEEMVESTTENNTESNTEEPTQVEEEIVESTTEESVEIETETGNVTVETESAENNNTTAVSKKTIEDELYDMLVSGDMGSRDVSSYKATLSEFFGMWPEFKEKNYILCKNGHSIYPSAEYSGNYVTKIKIVNMDSNFAQRYQKAVVTVNRFMAGVDDKMTDLDKVLWAHEFIVNNVSYKDTGKIAHTAGGALGDAQCVCDGYTDAMIALLKLVDVEAVYISSTDMNHSWTYVKLDGQWYHIDATWDDTRKGANGIYAHRYLLRNDSEFKTLSHYNWSSTGSAYGATSTSAKYENWFVHDIAGMMYYSNGLWYYYDKDSNSILSSKVNGTSTSVVVDGSNSDETLVIKGISSNVLTYTVNGITYTKSL